MDKDKHEPLVHSDLMGNPRNPSAHLGDYAEIVKEAYKGYLTYLFQEMVESVPEDAKGPSPETVQEFRRKVNNARRISMIATKILSEKTVPE